jgi:hypothetical protein
VRSVEIRPEPGVNTQKAIYVLDGEQALGPELVEEEDMQLTGRKNFEVPFQLLMIATDLHPS